MTYLSLSLEQRARFDPMITGFNPADMYATGHIKRVLKLFPGVFTGIGEFTIHKEFVSAKVAGVAASLTDPALDRILDFAKESGLLVLIHSDIDVPFAKLDAEPVYLSQMKALLRRHVTPIIWAHAGLGRVIHPVETTKDSDKVERNPDQPRILEAILTDPTLAHVHFDISWTEVAKYIVRTREATDVAARLINAHPDRVLFGTDEVAPTNRDGYLTVYRQYDPLWKKLTPDARDKVKRLNYERLFDAARTKVRAWERENLGR
jgi:predicted TIM-barrel fold metal-dependent hydrolase